MKKFILTTLFLIVIFQYSFYAQSLQIKSSYHDYKSIYLKTKVKLLDEFIKRFNGDYSYLGDSINKFSRQDKLRFIIDYEYWQKDSVLIESLIESITRNCFYIEFDKNNWYAKVECLFKYNKKPQIATINMQIETDSLGQSRWTLISAELPFINQNAIFSSDDFINPVNNETGFSEFHKMFSSEKILALTNSDFSYNHLSVFIYLLQTKQLEFQQVNNTTYIFYTSEYCFKVNNFNREHFNSGWLISEIEYNDLPVPIFYSIDRLKLQWENQNRKLLEIINSKNIF